MIQCGCKYSNHLNTEHLNTVQYGCTILRLMCCIIDTGGGGGGLVYRTLEYQMCWSVFHWSKNKMAAILLFHWLSKKRKGLNANKNPLSKPENKSDTIIIGYMYSNLLMYLIKFDVWRHQRITATLLMYLIKFDALEKFLFNDVAVLVPDRVSTSTGDVTFAGSNHLKN